MSAIQSGFGAQLSPAEVSAIAAAESASGVAAADPLYARVDGTHKFVAEQEGISPTSPDSLATKHYVDDSLVAGVHTAEPVAFIIPDATPLPAYTYANGALGVGATITADANGLIPVQDGWTPSPGERCLHECAANPEHGGIYVVTDVGVDDPGGAPFILTRATDADESADITPGLMVLVEGGLHAGTVELMNAFSVAPTVGTDDQVFYDIGGPLSDTTHGARGGGTLHHDAVAGGAAGFMTGADKTRLDGMVHGQDYQFARSEATSTTTSNAFASKLALTTPALTGTYRVESSCELTIASISKRSQARLYNATDGLEIGATDYVPSTSGVYRPFLFADEVTFAGAAKTFQIQIASQDNSTTVTGRRFRIALWRVA